MLFGHLALAALQHRYLKTATAPTLWGAIFPDLLDKSLCQLLRLTPSGRFYGHTLAMLGLTTLAVGGLKGRRAAWSWVAGYLGHLLGDSEGLVPWLYPLVTYEFPARDISLQEIMSLALLNPCRLKLDVLVCLWAWWAYRL